MNLINAQCHSHSHRIIDHCDFHLYEIFTVVGKSLIRTDNNIIEVQAGSSSHNFFISSNFMLTTNYTCQLQSTIQYQSINISTKPVSMLLMFKLMSICLSVSPNGITPITQHNDFSQTLGWDRPG